MGMKDSNSQDFATQSCVATAGHTSSELFDGQGAHYNSQDIVNIDMGMKDSNSQDDELDAAGCVRSATASHASPVAKDFDFSAVASGSVRSATASHASPDLTFALLEADGIPFDRERLTRLFYGLPSYL
eukprot:9848735-Karenia_brevis.AAC.1